MLKVIVDTNVLLVSISRKSSYNWLFLSFLNKEFEWIISNEILTEYEEQIGHHWHPNVATDVCKVLLEASNAILTTIHFRFNLIDADQDDNKFSDCAVAAGANYIITFDKHFDILKHTSFPAINVITPNTFKDLILENK